MAPVYVDRQEFPTVQLAAAAFAEDAERVTGIRPKTLEFSSSLLPKRLIIIGTVNHSPLIDSMRSSGTLDTTAIDGKWESALTAVVDHPFPGVDSALVIAGSDRRGTAFAVFDLSRAMGVSPWTWWADVPIKRHSFIAVNAGIYMQGPPSVQYRGIFLNDEDWGLRPWAAQKMDPELHNIGPHTYEKIFELLLRLRANTLWPAMHPGTLPFNAIPENAVLADKWGIVMGSSHSEALLRNNVGEWNERRDGPWNYQLNAAAINRYWDDRLKANGKFENIYTVGMRGVHDSGLEATGSSDVKARLVEEVISEQRRLLSERVSSKPGSVPQVLWLYKESLDLYRVGMKIPDDVTLGWTDDNYGYIRELPDQQEQERAGGSALYYHVSYFGDPHDYLWLCSTPPSLMREELAKAWEHGVQKMWILNVGDLKPAELDIDYFLRMAWNEPETATLTQHEFLVQWSREQFPPEYAPSIAQIMEQYYQLSFVRKPEFMGFNSNRQPIRRTDFNPLAWGDQNQQRIRAWEELETRTSTLGERLTGAYRAAFFELADYPIRAAAAQNAKFLWTDRSYLDVEQGRAQLALDDAQRAQAAYNEIQNLTTQYNSLCGRKWEGIVSSHPRNLRVFDMPTTADQSSDSNGLPQTWRPPIQQATRQSDVAAGIFSELNETVSIDAPHFSDSHNTAQGSWHSDAELGLPGGAVFFGEPGRTAEASWIHLGNLGSEKDSAVPWIGYNFTTTTAGSAILALYLLPTFPVDSNHKLHYAMILDNGAPIVLDASGTEQGGAGISPWSSNVLSNSEVQTVNLGNLHPGKHTLRLFYGDPGVFIQHILITFAGSPPGYPFPPETVQTGTK